MIEHKVVGNCGLLTTWLEAIGSSQPFGSFQGWSFYSFRKLTTAKGFMLVQHIVLTTLSVSGFGLQSSIIQHYYISSTTNVAIVLSTSYLKSCELPFSHKLKKSIINKQRRKECRHNLNKVTNSFRLGRNPEVVPNKSIIIQPKVCYLRLPTSQFVRTKQIPDKRHERTVLDLVVQIVEETTLGQKLEQKVFKRSVCTCLYRAARRAQPQRNVGLLD